MTDVCGLTFRRLGAPEAPVYQENAYRQLYFRQLSVAALSAAAVYYPVVDAIAKQFGEIIRQRREKASLSQEALAHKASLHRTYISLLELGKRTPSILVVKQL